MALTNKQLAFIREYTKDWNATQAAIRAGYSEHTARTIGSNLLTKVDILEAVNAALPSEATIKGRLALIAMGEREGVEIPHELKALELLGKAHGIFTDKVEHSGELSINYVSDWRNENAGD